MELDVKTKFNFRRETRSGAAQPLLQCESTTVHLRRGSDANFLPQFVHIQIITSFRGHHESQQTKHSFALKHNNKH
jgi:hypothetical protein